MIEDDKSWNCIIEANNPLTFSAINQASQAGILLYFPETSLQIQEQFPASYANEIIGTVDADEFLDGNSTNSRILIGLYVDRPYSISPDENGLKVSFPKTLAQPIDNKAPAFPTESKAAASGEPGFPPAGLLKSIKATPLKNHLLVEVYADGTIMDYRSFTINNPARIVFDINKIRSLHKGGQTLVVSSKWVKQIRYNSYPDKIRLVLDLEDQVMKKYLSFPTGTGLLIYVGQLPEPLNKNSDWE
ncbi:MAG: AMIN domain-containing protein [bacterium]|nr:AMIN domain-containing protein [bacterium]